MLAFLARSVFYSTGYYADLFKNIDRNILLKEFWDLTSKSKENNLSESSLGEDSTSGVETEIHGNEGFIKRFCTDFTQLAKDGHIDPVFGRDEELRMVVEILARRRKNNPICVGEPGVGKTSIVEGLALRVIHDDVPELKQLLELRDALKALKGPMGNEPEFRKKILELIKDESSREQLLQELKIES